MSRGLIGAFVLLCAAWLFTYYMTETANPAIQASFLRARWVGGSRTSREDRTAMALFHLGYAIKQTYVLTDAKSENSTLIPTTWSELLKDTQGYRGSHLGGALGDAYPFLLKPHDPWGHAWIFRVEEIHEGSHGNDLRMTFGSVGPDGKECGAPVDAERVAEKLGCDDIISASMLLNIASERILFVVQRAEDWGETRTFVVPDPLWKP